MRWKRFNLVLTLLWSGLIGWSAVNINANVQRMREDAGVTLEHQEQLASYLAGVRNLVAEPEGVDPESLRQMELLLPEAEGALAECTRRAEAIANKGWISLALHPINGGTRDFEELHQAQLRLKERFELLVPLVKEVRMRQQEEEDACYCSCARPGGYAAPKGRKTPRECKDLCERDGSARAICT